MANGYSNLCSQYPALPKELKPQQYEIVDKICQGKNVLGVLPTGFGKSLTFAVPPLLKEGVALVISPLKALMSNQVNSLERMGIPAVALMAEDTTEEEITSKRL